MLTGKIIATLFIGWLMLLNAQPWLRFAEYTAPLMAKVPLLEALIKIPFLGGWVEFIASNIVAIAGILAWGLIQFLQVLPMAYDQERVLSNLISQWQNKQFDTEKEKNAALKKLKQAYNKLPSEDIDALKTYRMWAYVAEFAACFWLYCPYEGGIEALIKDAWAWDYDNILWPSLLMIPVTMFGFEVLLKVVIRIWRLGKTTQAFSYQ